MPSHDCPATACTRSVPAHMLMCRPHWFMVPKAIREAIWAAWANGAGRGTPAHVAAIRDAIEAVNARLAEMAT